MRTSGDAHVRSIRTSGSYSDLERWAHQCTCRSRVNDRFEVDPSAEQLATSFQGLLTATERALPGNSGATIKRGFESLSRTTEYS
jgi:hypothetical protein